MSTLEQTAPRAAAPPVRRRNRWWMVLLMLTPVCLVVVALLAYGTSGPSEPDVHPVSVPAGWQAVSDPYFGFSVPASWSPQNEWTDQTGDTFYGRPVAFAAESVIVPKLAPTAATAPPRVLGSFGVGVPVATTVVGAVRSVTVPGVTSAWAMTVTRPGGWRGTALDVWEGSTSTELWLLVHADRATTATIVRTLQGA